MYEGDWSILMINYFCMHLICLLTSLCYFFQSILFSKLPSFACESSALVCRGDAQETFL
jgi:hypothetical protein